MAAAAPEGAMAHRTLVSILLLLLPATAKGADHQVLIGNFTFTPSRLTVQAGDTVTWLNTGGIHSVTAEDGSFASGDAAPDDSPVWPFTQRFDRPGVFPYFCIPHEFHGMRGVVEVQGPNHPGVAELAATAFSVAEGEGGAVIAVRRAKGSTGAISVTYSARVFSANPGNATPGADFTEVSGTLAWADGENADRLFTVPILDDSALEDEETLTLDLRSPQGGATLDPQSRTAGLKIVDDDGSQPLSASEVSCDAARLSGLLARAVAEAPGGAAAGLNLTLTASGDFAGLAYAASGPAGREHHLAFSTNPEETPLLRNPSRLQLSSLSLTRNALSSDLVAKGHAGEVRLGINPAVDPGAVPALRIDNVDGPAGIATDANPGRGLDAALAPCHGRFSSQDAHVLRLLAKVARATAAGAGSFELAIFRGEAPASYRVDVYPIAPSGASLGRLAVEISAHFGAGAGGSLLNGSLRVLGRCSASRREHCTSVTGATELLLLPPAASGQPAGPAAARVSTFGVEGDGQPEDGIDWQALLAGTSWQRPL
jgi:plastocyanin